MQESYISYKTAQLAKEKGFNWNCFGHYTSDESLQTIHDYIKYDATLTEMYERNFNSVDWMKEICLAPTQSLLQRWLREVHKIDVVALSYDNIPIDYCSHVYLHTPNNNLKKQVLSAKPTCEEALEDGLKVGLNLIP